MLDSILRQIDQIYDLDLEVDIRDFLVTEDTCARLGLDPAHGSVLVKQERGSEELELGLYLGEENLSRLSRLDLSNSLSGESFALLALAIEEVSHFAYLLFSAARDRCVTQLELELQAEVDKFVTATLLLASENGGRVPSNLLDRLFGDFEVRRELDDGRKQRYLAASSLASRYCAHFVRVSLSERGLAALLPELRDFYRLGQRGKIGKIHNIVYAA